MPTFRRPTRSELLINLPNILSLLTTDNSNTFNSTLNKISQQRLAQIEAEKEREREKEQERLRAEQAKLDRETTRQVHSADRQSREKIAETNVKSREKIAAENRDLQQIHFEAQQNQKNLWNQRRLNLQKELAELQSQTQLTTTQMVGERQKEVLDKQLENELFRSYSAAGIKPLIAKSLASKASRGNFDNLTEEERIAMTLADNAMSQKTELQKIQNVLGILNGASQAEIPLTDDSGEPFVPFGSNKTVTRPLTPAEVLNVVEDPESFLRNLANSVATSGNNPDEVPTSTGQSVGEINEEQANELAKEQLANNEVLQQAVVRANKDLTVATEFGTALVNDVGFERAKLIILNSDLKPSAKDRALQAASNAATSSAIRDVLSGRN